MPSLHSRQLTRERTAAFFFPSSKCQAAWSILPRSPNPPSLPHVRIPSIPIGLSTIPHLLIFHVFANTKKSPPYHISRLCKDPIDIAEWSHLKNLLKSCFHQFSVFFKGNLTLWLLSTSQNCSVRLLWTSQTLNISELTSLALLFPIISRSASVLSSW